MAEVRQASLYLPTIRLVLSNSWSADLKIVNPVALGASPAFEQVQTKDRGASGEAHNGAQSHIRT
eukprot:1149959-Pelagomonas_calceolata.AAC.7